VQYIRSNPGSVSTIEIEKCSLMGREFSENSQAQSLSLFHKSESGRCCTWTLSSRVVRTTQEMSRLFLDYFSSADFRLIARPDMSHQSCENGRSGEVAG